MAFFKAYDRYGIEAISVTLERFLILVFGLIILTFNASLINLMWIFFWVRLVDVCVTYYVLNKSTLKTILMFDFRFIRTLQITALPLGIYIYVAFLYGYVDTVMLSFIKGSTEVGWYNAAYRIYDGLIILPFIVHYGLLPPLSKYFIGDREKYLQLSGEVIGYVMIVTLPIAIVLAQQAGFVIHGLFGNDFQLAVPAFKVLMVGLFFTYPIVIFNCILISMDKLKPILYLAGIGLIANVISNLLLIPKFGYLGAAISTASSEILVFAVTMLYLDKVNKKLMLPGKMMRFFIATVIVVLILIIGNELGLSAVLVMGICAIAYVISLTLLKLVDMRRVGLIFKILHSSKV